MIPCARCILLNLYHILVDGLFDTVPFVLSFMALAYGSGETDVGLVVSLGTALSTVAGLGTGWVSRRFGFSGSVALLTGIAGVGFAGAALSAPYAAEMAWPPSFRRQNTPRQPAQTKRRPAGSTDSSRPTNPCRVV